MFGDQGDDAAAPQTGGGSAPQDDTLKGVADLVGGSASPAPTAQDDSQGGTFLPRPSDVPSGPPAPAPEAEQEVQAPTRGAGNDTGGDELLDLKQQALQQLTPLVGHLDQTPLEKFRTTMMLIQASDNQALLKDAYAAAQAIEDEKIRAQALLDVVNEINYFTQSKDQ